MKGVGLYVHVPFCVRRCHYCDFSVARSAVAPVEGYLEALCADIRQWKAELDTDGPIDVGTIYVGGGTPSLLGVDGMRALVGVLRGAFRWADDVEWTAEANPNSVTPALCEAWADLGIGRISIGVQSFQDAALDWLGRLHDARQARSAIAMARRVGLEVNADLIFGLPSDVPRDWSLDLATMIDSGADHVSAYGLTAEPRTPLGRWVDAGRVRLAGGSRYADEYLEAAERLADAGFEHYEVSNFARPGRMSRHNWHYWDGTEYLGIGPSAHSLLRSERVWNVYRWDAYLAAARDGGSLRAGRETPDRAQRRLEEIWLGLRTRRGVDLGDLGLGSASSVALNRWEAAGWVTARSPRLTLSPAGWLRLDELAAEMASWPVGCTISTG